MEKFCEDLRKHTTVIINYDKKEVLPLTAQEIESNNDQKFYHIFKKKFQDIG